MSREIEDGLGHSGLVATRAEREQDKRDQAERKRIKGMEARIAQLEETLRRTKAALAQTSPVLWRSLKTAIDAALSGARTAGEPLPKLECGMGCGRTFCSAEGRDHHEELCSGTAKHG